MLFSIIVPIGAAAAAGTVGFLIGRGMVRPVFVSDPEDDGAGCSAEEDSAPAGMSETEALDNLGLEPGAGAAAAGTGGFFIGREMAPPVFVPDPEDDGAGRGAEEDSAPAGMSETEALDILELEPGAGPDAIAEAHGRLIQRLDSERGGSGHLTKLVDRAKDVLLA